MVPVTGPKKDIGDWVGEGKGWGRGGGRGEGGRGGRGEGGEGRRGEGGRGGGEKGGRGGGELNNITSPHHLCGLFCVSHER